MPSALSQKPLHKALPASKRPAFSAYPALYCSRATVAALRAWVAAKPVPQGCKCFLALRMDFIVKYAIIIAVPLGF